VIDRELKRPLNEFRAILGLPAVSRVFRHWVHSPQCVIGFFPEWFAAPQTDWPPHTYLVGFPLWDGADGSALVPPEAEEFFNAGDAPVIFTPGSAGSTMHRYFRESVDAARTLGIRAMLVTNYPAQLPRELPLGVHAFGYLPFSQVLPRAALLVYHGGIGTLAQTVKAGIPHLVVPNGHDQFDNAWRIEQLGLGRSIPQTRYRAAPVAQAIQAILANGALKARTQEYAARIDSHASLTRACELIEGLMAPRS
jgi:rhamnosyltransferase subunit B